MPCGNTSVMVAPDVLGPRLGVIARRVARRDKWREISAHVLCANGLSFDVVVGSGRQCLPDSDTGPWTHIEVVGLNRALTTLDRYRCEASVGQSSVARHNKVPLDDLNRLIARNGGLS